MARPTIFGQKHGRRYAGNVTKVAESKMEAARHRLADLSGWPVGAVSDSDVFEFLARGEPDTRRYLKAQKAAS